MVTQYAMNALTDLGMLKMDFLGLKTLTVLEDAVRMIHEHVPDFDLAKMSERRSRLFRHLQPGRNPRGVPDGKRRHHQLL